MAMMDIELERQCSTLTREVCEILLTNISIQVYDHDPIEELREAVYLNVKDGTIDSDIFWAACND